MGHYLLGILTRNKPSESEIINLLAPFDENLDEPYFDIRPHMERLNEQRTGLLKNIQSQIRLKEENREEYDRLCAAEGRDVLERLFEELGRLVQYIREYTEEGTPLDNWESAGISVNPDARWDWWEIGSGSEPGIPVKGSSERVDQIQVGMIDLPDDELLNQLAADEKEIQEWIDKTTGKSVYNREFYQVRYSSCLEYVRAKYVFTTGAVLLEDGTWLEPDHMFSTDGTSSSAEDLLRFDRIFPSILKTYGEDGWLTLVECHI